MESSIPGDAEAPSLRGDLSAIVRGYRAAAGSTADLAAAELRLAASTTVLLLALAIAIALFASAAWLLLMLALAALLADASAWPAALTAIAGANLLAALGCWTWMRAITPNLTFRELRAALAGGAAPGDDAAQQTAGG